ncbi:MAG: ABC transporter permease [Acidimicrobiia bacterium]|nr:ABC transporter permease [Acidimicrobiia bacterium]
MSTDTTEQATDTPLRAYRVLAFPVAVLGIFFLAPFGFMLATSFYRRIEGGFYEPAFVTDSYERLFSKIFLERTAFSIQICLLVALLVVLIGFPFTFFLTRMRQRSQTVLLVLTLSALTLSEVIVAFSWNVILGRSSGLSNVLVWLGLMSEPKSYAPSYLAVVLGLMYIAFPYCILTLYPSLSRLDREITEAAETLGASPWRTFWTVVVPISRLTILAAFLLVFVFTLGSYLIAAILGRPQHWTLSVFISDQATFNANVPFAAAMAMFLTVLSLAIVGAVSWLGGRGERVS